MAGAAPQGNPEKMMKLSNWVHQPEEVYAKRMRTLRQISVDSDTLSCLEQYREVLNKHNDWDNEDCELQNLMAEKDTGKRRRYQFLGPLGEFRPRPSPPPGSGAVGSGAAAASGPETPSTGHQPTPLEEIAADFNDGSPEQVELNQRLRAAGYRIPSIESGRGAAEQGDAGGERA